MNSDRFVTRKKFREICGGENNLLAHSTLTTAIKHNVVVEKKDATGHYIIDLQDPVNRKYIERWATRSMKTISKNVVEAEQRKKQLEIQLRERDVKIKDITIAKLNGEVIPTELVGMIIKNYSKHLLQELRYAAERITVDAMRVAGGTKAQSARMKGSLIAAINGAAERARANRDRDIKGIIKDYKQSKG